MQKEQVNEFKGYSLFNQIEDFELKAYNRGRIIFNILEDGYDVKLQKASAKASALAIQYMEQIPKGIERDATFHNLRNIMLKEGMINASK